MRKMKNSNLQWIGEIPAEWCIRRIKNIGSSRNGLTYTPNDICGETEGTLVLRSSNIKNGKISTTDNVYVSCPIPARLKVKSGDILICSRNGSRELVGKNALIGSEINATYGAFMMVYRCPCPKYMYYVLNSNVFSYYLGSFATSTINQLTGSDFGNMKIAYCPNVSEQQRIADFLDEKCGEIDSIRSDVQREIEILNDYKKSVITEAVTKGLNPKAKLKDSGIEWIGKIPEHWGVDKLKFHLKFRGTKNPGDTIVLSLYRELGVVPKDSRDDNHNKTSEDTSNYRFVRNGDFVINKMKAWQGSVAVSDYEGIVSPAYYVYGFSDDLIFKRYFHYLLRDKSYATEFKRLSGGIRVGQWDLPRESLENTLILLPPISEQKNIAAYLDEMCSEIDATIADKQKQLETLDEYKKSLIFEYVTGKKEVPA